MNEQELRRDRALVLSGDVEAAERFVLALGPRIRGIWRRMRLSNEEIDDAYQEFFGRLWDDDLRRLRNWQARGSLGGYLSVIARNLGFEVIDRRVLVRAFDAEGNPAADADRGIYPNLQGAFVPDVARSSEAMETMDVVTKAMASLALRDREVLSRRHFLGRSYLEIAADMGISVNHVGVLLYRAEARLRRLLPHEITPPWAA